jgi:hypothetical protein
MLFLAGYLARGLLALLVLGLLLAQCHAGV